MECSFWEFGAIVRHEKRRYEAGLVSPTEARRTFDVPSFVTWRNQGLPQPSDPQRTLADAKARAQAKGWIQRDGQLNDQWYDIVTTLAYDRFVFCLYLSAPDEAETRAMVTVSEGLAFRVVLVREQVWIDEVHPDSAEQAVVACLPDADTASGTGVLVSTRVLHAAGIEAEQHRADQGDWIAYELGQADIPATEAKKAGRMLRSRDRTVGEFNVGIREGAVRRMSQSALVIHHSPSGRVAQIPQPPDGARTLITPASLSVVASALRAYRDDLLAAAGDL